MTDKSIKELIQELANDQAAELYAKPCEVIDVDVNGRVVDVKPYDGTASIFGVQLQAIRGSQKGVVYVPKKGSGVLVVFISKSRAFVASYEQLDEIVIDVDKVTYNGGDNGGIFKAPELLSEINKLKARMTALEIALTTFGTAQNTAALAVPVLAPLAPAPAALVASVSALPPSGNFASSLINDKIKH